MGKDLRKEFWFYGFCEDTRGEISDKKCNIFERYIAKNLHFDLNFAR